VVGTENGLIVSTYSANRVSMWHTESHKMITILATSACEYMVEYEGLVSGFQQHPEPVIRQSSTIKSSGIDCRMNINTIHSLVRCVKSL
jgi:hypothetical protein